MRLTLHLAEIGCTAATAAVAGAASGSAKELRAAAVASSPSLVIRPPGGWDAPDPSPRRDRVHGSDGGGGRRRERECQGAESCGGRQQSELGHTTSRGMGCA